MTDPLPPSQEDALKEKGANYQSGAAFSEVAINLLVAQVMHKHLILKSLHEKLLRLIFQGYANIELLLLFYDVYQFVLENGSI